MNNHKNLKIIGILSLAMSTAAVSACANTAAVRQPAAAVNTSPAYQITPTTRAPEKLAQMVSETRKCLEWKKVRKMSVNTQKRMCVRYESRPVDKIELPKDKGLGSDGGGITNDQITSRGDGKQVVMGSREDAAENAPAVQMTGLDVFERIQNNALAFNRQFGGKRVQMDGHYLKVSLEDGQFGTLITMKPFSQNYGRSGIVTCLVKKEGVTQQYAQSIYNQEERDKMSLLEKEQSMTISGRLPRQVNPRDGNILVLHDCTIDRL